MPRQERLDVVVHRSHQPQPLPRVPHPGEGVQEVEHAFLKRGGADEQHLERALRRLPAWPEALEPGAIGKLSHLVGRNASIHERLQGERGGDRDHIGELVLRLLLIDRAMTTSQGRHELQAANAVPVCSAIASGKIQKLDTAAAEKMPGVRAIFHRENIGKIFRSTPGEGFEGIVDERRPPFEDDVIRYYGQYIALAVADSFENAKAAARAAYTKEKPNVDPDLKADDEPDVVPTTFIPTKRVQSERGDPEGAFASAPARLDQTYVTPTHTHNPIELQGATAVWEGSMLTIYEESQAIFNLQGVLAQMFGLPVENVRVITKFVGSGFGSKLWPWTHCMLAIAAARQLGKPVKLVLSRKMMFQSVGHRPRTQQRVRLGATPDGKLVSLQHDYVNHHAMLDNYHEDCGEATAFHYSVPNLRVKFGRARRNVGTPTAMRGPGAVPGLYATESALNELAAQLKIDPVQIRVLNEPKIDESLGIPFSSRHLLECPAR